MDMTCRAAISLLLALAAVPSLATSAVGSSTPSSSTLNVPAADTAAASNITKSDAEAERLFANTLENAGGGAARLLPHRAPSPTMEERLHNLRHQGETIIDDETSSSVDYATVIRQVDDAFRPEAGDDIPSHNAAMAAGRITADMLEHPAIDPLDLVLIEPEAQPEDALFLRARQAYRAGDAMLLRACTDTIDANTRGSHPLSGYLHFWALMLRLKAAPSDPIVNADMERFIATHRSQYLGETAATQYLSIAAPFLDLPTFERFYNALVWNRSDVELTNWWYYFRLQSVFLRDGGRDETLLDNAKSHLRDQTQVTDSYRQLGDLVSRLDRQWSWTRVLISLQKKHWEEAKRALRAVPRPQLPAPLDTLDALIDRPQEWFRANENRLSRIHARLGLMAVFRIAAVNPDEAQSVAEAMTPKLRASLNATVWNFLGYHAVTSLRPQAFELFLKAGNTLMDPEVTVRASQILSWQARAALREGKWYSLENIIERMPDNLQNEDVWTYWRARALRVMGQYSRADGLFSRISSHTSFYGKLACDALGRPYANPLPPASEPPEAEVARWEDNDSLERAVDFYRMGLFAEGHREWNWAMRGLKPQDYIALAEYAKEKFLIHRMINTSLRSGNQYVDMSQRFPTPHRNLVVRVAKGQGLPQSWIYGLIRQESRFIPKVSSSVGARGLMQIMPSTAAWIARKLSLEAYELDKLTDIETNIILGSSYLRMLYDDLGHSYPLATAAYNAGPARARLWRTTVQSPMEAAVFAETIPFHETRDYVKAVMTNMHTYALLSGQSINFTNLLGTVSPNPATRSHLP